MEAAGVKLLPKQFTASAQRTGGVGDGEASASGTLNGGRTTDMAGSLRAVIALPRRCCSRLAGAEWLAVQGADGAGRIFRSRLSARAHHDAAAPRLSSASDEAAFGFGRPRTLLTARCSLLTAQHPPEPTPSAPSLSPRRPPTTIPSRMLPPAAVAHDLDACADHVLHTASIVAHGEPRAQKRLRLRL